MFHKDIKVGEGLNKGGLVGKGMQRVLWRVKESYDPFVDVGDQKSMAGRKGRKVGRQGEAKKTSHSCIGL